MRFSGSVFGQEWRVFKTVLHFGLFRQKNNFVSKDADSILPAVSSICRNEYYFVWLNTPSFPHRCFVHPLSSRDSHLFCNYF